MKIVIIGGGPAGMMCASICSQNPQNEVVLLDSNEKLGKKLYITGKGRCNLTNLVPPQEFLSSVVTNPKFLYSCIYAFTSQDTRDYFGSLGLKTIVERGNRVFPSSEKASDVTKAFVSALTKNNVKINLNCQVKSINKQNDGCFKLVTNRGQIICDALVLATGGTSYKSTGSTGDGYAFCKSFGHNIIPPKPSLVPILLKKYDGKLAGLSLKNVTATIKTKDKTISEFGEMLFTHNGVSGPIVLSLSALANKMDLKSSIFSIDLKPSLSIEQLDNRLLRDFEEGKTKQLKNYLKTLMPISLVQEFLCKIRIDENTRLCDITKPQRESIIRLLKDFSYDILSLDNIDYAIVTSGGVDVREVNPKNMMSKLVPNLFIVGELLDVDAYTGGFNIQIALSTGHAAGEYLRDNSI